jgi:uncharacterized Zn-binding protein involved in type VI secretion
MAEEKRPPGGPGTEPGAAPQGAGGGAGGGGAGGLTGEEKEDESGWRIPKLTGGVEKKAGADKAEQEVELGPFYEKESKPKALKTWGTEKPDEIGDKDKNYAALVQTKASLEVLSGSFNLVEKKAKLTLVDGKAQISLFHAEAKGQWDPAVLLKDFLLGKDTAAPSGDKPPAMAPMAARLADPTSHLMLPLAPGPGSTNVFIGGMPAWRAGIDIHVCAAPGGHGAGPTTPGAPTVLINGFPAARATDFVVEPLGGPDPIVMGCPTVMIGIATVAPPAPPKSLVKKVVGGILDAMSGWVLWEVGAKGDVGKASVEGKVAAEGSLKEGKVVVEAKGSIGAVSAAASIPLKVRIRIPWTEHYVGIGLTLEGTGPGLGAEAGGDIKVNDGQTFFSAGAGAKVTPLAAGVGVKASLDIAKK